MPRTSVVESPGCPPLRVLTTDVLGLIKVVEVRENLGVPKVVETWGSPNTSQSVLVASIDDRKYNPLLAVARRNGLVELFNPLNGDALASVRVIETSSTQPAASGDDSITGLHLFKREKLDQQSRSCTLLACTENRKASLRTIDLSNLSAGSQSTDSPNTWDISGAGKVLCCAVDGDEKFALFGGKGIEVNLWDLENCTKTWAAKSPPRNSLDLFTPTWFTAATFLCKNDHRKFAAGTNNHQVRIYDTSAQRRPVISFEFRETAIKAVAAELDGNTVYVGNGTGDLASFDIRTGRLLGSFVGKCSGSIRSIAKHPELPVLASCGLDSYVRFWDTRTRQLLYAVFLKQHLTSVVVDTNFSYEETAANPSDESGKVQSVDRTEDGDEEDIESPTERKTSSKENKRSKKKHKLKVQGDDDPHMVLNNIEAVESMNENTGERGQRKRSKNRKSKQRNSGDGGKDDEDSDSDGQCEKLKHIKLKKRDTHYNGDDGDSDRKSKKKLKHKKLKKRVDDAADDDE